MKNRYFIIFIMTLIIAGAYLSLHKQSDHAPQAVRHNMGASVEEGVPQVKERLTDDGGAAGLLAGASISAKERRHIAAVATSYCASYVHASQQVRDKIYASTKIGHWCKGVDSIVLTSRGPQIATAADISDVVEDASKIFSSGLVVNRRVVSDLLMRADSPEEMGAVAQVMDMYDSSGLWKEAGIDRSSVVNAQVLSRFSGLIAGCQENYCGPGAIATIDVCMWPGHSCGKDMDFDAAVISNFSRNDVGRMMLLAHQIGVIRSGRSNVGHSP